MDGGQEKQNEIDKLKKENEELIEKLKSLELEKKEEKPTVPDNTLNEIWAALALLQKQIVCANSAQIKTTLGLQQNIGQISSKIDQILKTVKKQAKHQDSLEGKIQVPSRSEGRQSNTGKKKSDTILILGGSNNNETHSLMAVWNSTRSKWIQLNLELPYGTGWGGAVYLNEEIYIFGGFPNPKTLYKLGKNMKWTQLADMNEERTRISNCSLEMNGFIWVFGGQTGGFKCLKSVERYDPNEDKWTLMPEMKYPRYFAAATRWKGKFVVCGGRGLSNEILSTVECFDQQSGVWTEWEELPSPRSGHSLISYYSSLVLLGGYIREHESMEIVLVLYPPEANATWKPSSFMKIPAVGFPAVVLDMEIFAIGGLYQSYQDLSRVEIFDGKNWRDGPPLPYESRNMPALSIPQHFADLLCKQ